MYADDQLEELMMMPNIPARVIDAAKQFPQHVKDMEKAKASTMVAHRRATDRERTQAASANVAEAHSRLEELGDLVDSGKVSAHAAIQEIARIESRLQEAQRRHEALANSEARYALIEADPSALSTRSTPGIPASGTGALTCVTTSLSEGCPANTDRPSARRSWAPLRRGSPSTERPQQP